MTGGLASAPPSLLPSTYLQLLLVFGLPPLCLLVATAKAPSAERKWTLPLGIALLCAGVVAYATPWDNYLIAKGVWWFSAGAVGTRIWHAPIEDYLLFALIPVLTGLWLNRLPTASHRGLSIDHRNRLFGLVGGVAVGGLGWLLFAGRTYYLGGLLLWAAPLLAVQWTIGWPVLWDLRHTIQLGVWVPTVYLCVLDRIAIALGVWRFDGAYLTGYGLFGLPVEEIAFFALMTLLVVQGLLLFWWITDRWALTDERAAGASAG
ncbi:MAG: lycopene cyclase domain-containing protein [Haloarculaceae archaeon]